jgi:hypothetical protein
MTFDVEYSDVIGLVYIRRKVHLRYSTPCRMYL